MHQRLDRHRASTFGTRKGLVTIADQVLAWLSCNRTALQAMEMSRELLRLRVMYAVVSMALSAAAALLLGTARSMSAGLAVSAVLMLFPTWMVARRKAAAQ